jgi:hypothetical protein
MATCRREQLSSTKGSKRLADNRVWVFAARCGLLAVRGDAFANDVNAFNGAMNLGNRLSQWFTAEFGSNQCAAITQCDFSTVEGVQRYVEGGGAARCSAIAERVAIRVLGMMQPADADA